MTEVHRNDPINTNSLPTENNWKSMFGFVRRSERDDIGEKQEKNR